MIAGGRSVLRTSPEQGTFGVEFYIGCFSVHQFPCVRDHCAECGADGLMTQADAEDGDFLSQGGYDFCDNAGFFRSSGAGERMI